jgi:hypothetical protein
MPELIPEPDSTGCESQKKKRKKKECLIALLISNFYTL